MIETYTIYDLGTGEIIRTMRTGNPELLALNLAESEDFAEGLWDADLYYFASGVAVEMPPRPSETAVFDYATKAWVEPYTPEEILDQKRAAATLDRFTFCNRCFEKGILSRSDALALGHGQIPPSTRVILDSMDPADSFDAELRWGAMSTVGRLDPLILATAAASGIPEIMLDHLFDVFPYSHAPEE